MTKLATVYAGWEGYQESLVGAVASLTAEQLVWRPAAQRRSVREIVRHVALGRVSWFARMGAPGMDAITRQWTVWRIMAHDLHHGGQLAMLLGVLEVEAFELRALGGHVVFPNLATPDRDDAADLEGAP